ncbi:MAG TPA: DNA alkylation repair protein [Gemmatimonadales bacterium]|nr:DNA alkylation repair protein [Gemmatimonadales bacterium]
MTTDPRALQKQVRALANPADARFLQRFFKTGPGEYGEGDRFLGIRVPVTRRLVREYQGPAIPAARQLIKSPFHEERLLAVLLLVRAYDRATPTTQVEIYRLYLSNTPYINNWDIVDSSAPHIVGRHLLKRDRRVLNRLARSRNLWERRIAVLATQSFIRAGEFTPTLHLAERLLDDRHDLMHKAIGWMLREVGDRDRSALEEFLGRYAESMPRTMLRYAIEKLPPRVRRRYMKPRGRQAIARK